MVQVVHVSTLGNCDSLTPLGLANGSGSPRLQRDPSTYEEAGGGRAVTSTRAETWLHFRGKGDMPSPPPSPDSSIVLLEGIPKHAPAAQLWLLPSPRGHQSADQHDGAADGPGPEMSTTWGGAEQPGMKQKLLESRDTSTTAGSVTQSRTPGLSEPSLLTCKTEFLLALFLRETHHASTPPHTHTHSAPGADRHLQPFQHSRGPRAH